MIRLKTILLEEKKKSEKSDFDRTEFYKKYLENLLPENFKVDLQDDELVIKIK
jgi:hypothetical protein